MAFRGMARRARLARIVGWMATAVLGLVAVTVADAARPRKLPNMPRGWTWPPSRAMKTAGQACLEDLDRLGVRYERAEPVRKIATPIVVEDMKLGGIELQPIFREPPFVMDCHLARALMIHGPKLRLIGIAALRFSTIHEYRTIRRRGKRTRILSRHAIGLAMDVFELVLVDGSVLPVEKAYPARHPALLAAELTINATGDFRTLLTPGNDPKSHDDHFHFEARMDLGPPTR